MTIEVTAKKVDDAIKQGLEQLGASLDEVKVEVLESGGLFRKAKVRLTLETEEKTEEQPETKKSEPAEKTTKTESAEKPAAKKPEKTEKSAKAEKSVTEKPVATKTEKTANAEKPAAKQPVKTDKAEKHASEKTEKIEKPRERSAEDKAAAEHAATFVKDVIGLMGFDGAEVEASTEVINITAPAGDDSLIIGRHGETLSALGYLAETCVRAEKCHVNVTVDCNGYRDRRAASLTAMAKRRANECASKHRKIKLEPMERIDRRTIHNALTGDDRVTTASEGKEPRRYVVIIPR